MLEHLSFFQIFYKNSFSGYRGKTSFLLHKNLATFAFKKKRPLKRLYNETSQNTEEVDTNQEANLTQANSIPNATLEVISTKMPKNLDLYTNNGCIVVTPFTIKGVDDKIYLCHAYGIGKWCSIFISLPTATKIEHYEAAFGQAGAFMKEVGAAFLTTENPGLDLSRLLRVTNIKQHHAIKDYMLNYLSYALHANEMCVFEPRLLKLNITPVEASHSLHWSLQPFFVDSTDFTEGVDYCSGVEGIQPHKKQLAAELYYKLNLSYHQIRENKENFERSIELFKDQDAFLSEETRSLLAKHEILATLPQIEPLDSFSDDSNRTNNSMVANYQKEDSYDYSNNFWKTLATSINHSLEVKPEQSMLSGDSLIEEGRSNPQPLVANLNIKKREFKFEQAIFEDNSSVEAVRLKSIDFEIKGEAKVKKPKVNPHVLSEDSIVEETPLVTGSIHQTITKKPT